MPMVTSEMPINQPAVPFRRHENVLALVWLLGSFLILYFVTTSTESGDTLRYAGDVVHHARGESAQFWEFGHLLWRPWGYLGLKSLGWWFQRQFGDTDVQAVARFFIFTNFVCCLATLVLIWNLLRRLVSLRLATLVAIAFCGANCFLDYVAVGSAYLPALCFECLALWLLVEASEYPRRALTWTCFAGVSYALSVLLWFPYLFAGAGMLLFLLLWPLNERDKRQAAVSSIAKIPQGATFLIAFAASYAAILVVGGAANGIGSVAQFKQWIVDSDSGWSQHLNLVRAATGVPRSLYELASDTILLKRWFFHDPYNPVHIRELAGALFLKLALFYFGIAAITWILARGKSHRERAAFVVLLGASVPLLFFAIVVFEPGSTSRYLPLLPFLYLAAAVALAKGSSRRIAYAGVIVLLTSALVFNVFTLTRGASALSSEVRRQRDLLDQQINGHAIVFIPTLHDAFYYVPLTRPIDHGLSSSKYLTIDVVEAASLRLLHWRAEFAARVLNTWKEGQAVWISQRVYAARPHADWAWVEGDDPRIRWAELPPFFEQFQTDAAVNSGEDGFVRLAQTPSNKLLLERLVAEDPKYSR